MVTFTLNGKTVSGREDQTLLEIADAQGVEIPRLCYMDGMRPDGNCRSCMVEIKGERVLAPSCCRYPKQGMEVTTNSPRALTSQKMVFELLLSDMPETSYTLDSELDQWAKKLDVGKPRFRARPPDGSHHWGQGLSFGRPTTTGVQAILLGDPNFGKNVGRVDLLRLDRGKTVEATAPKRPLEAEPSDG